MSGALSGDSVLSSIDLGKTVVWRNNRKEKKHGLYQRVRKAGRTIYFYQARSQRDFAYFFCVDGKRSVHIVDVPSGGGILTVADNSLSFFV